MRKTQYDIENYLECSGEDMNNNTYLECGGEDLNNSNIDVNNHVNNNNGMNDNFINDINNNNQIVMNNYPLSQANSDITINTDGIFQQYNEDNNDCEIL